MCGIAGYVGGGNAPEILFDMLKRLEYRGYDSAGLAVIVGDEIVIPKDKGKVDEVRAKVKPEEFKSNIGVAHTRWATHGKPSELNAHPHSDCTGEFVVAHNGIIENHAELKKELEVRGHKFASETDTEVVAHLLEEYFGELGDFLKAFEVVIERLEGSFALTALHVKNPDRILIARNESPLLVGVAGGETYVASDAPAFLPYTKKVIILEDGDYGVVSMKGVELWSLESKSRVDRKPHEITWDVEEAEKAGYHHFMLKEIMEEPDAAKNALAGEEEVEAIAGKLSKFDRIYFVACGTAYHAGLVGKYVLEQYGIPSEAVVASEFRYSTLNTVDDKCAVVGITQSGETADTLAAVKGAKKRGAYVASIVNVVGSTQARVSDDVAFIRSGPEIAVASTKAYIGQVISATLLALHLAKERGKISDKDFNDLKGELSSVPGKIKEILDANNIRGLAEENAGTNTFFFIGRRQNYPTALEGALKIKEIAYVHAEGYAAGELKHGPLALMEEGVVVVSILAGDELDGKVDSNISEVRSRSATVVTVGEKGDIKVPKTHPLLTPVLAIVPLHLFSYYISVLRGLDPDKPRNLAKSVTVE